MEKFVRACEVGDKSNAKKEASEILSEFDEGIIDEFVDFCMKYLSLDYDWEEEVDRLMVECFELVERVCKQQNHRLFKCICTVFAREFYSEESHESMFPTICSLEDVEMVKWFYDKFMQDSNDGEYVFREAHEWASYPVREWLCSEVCIQYKDESC